jgi:glutamyl-Q tRNA(Asp) synthetase
VLRQSAQFHHYRDALAKLAAQNLTYASFESRAEIALLVAARERQGPWPRDPDGTPLYPGIGRSLTPAERERRITAGEPYAVRLDTAAACERIGPLSWTDTGDGPSGESGGIAADPAAWGDPVLARKWWSTMRARASPMWCAGRTCSGRPASIACCRRCSDCRNRTTTIIA